MNNVLWEAMRRGLGGVLGVGVVVAGAEVHGATIARDSFLVADPVVVRDSGEYSTEHVASTAVTPQNPRVLGFEDPWSGTTGTIRATGVGLTHGDMPVLGGSLQFSHTSSLRTYRSVTRTMTDSYDTGASAYYIRGLMSFDFAFGTTLVVGSDSSSSIALTGFLNAEDTNVHSTTTPDPGAGAGLRLGMQWGFQGDGSGGVDAVIRLRDTNGDITNHVVQSGVSIGTHQFVMKVEVDAVNSSERVSVWLNPADFSSEAAAGGATHTGLYSNWVSGSGNSSRIVDTLVVNATNVGTNSTIHYDEFHFADSWDDLWVDAGYTRFQKGVNGYSHLGSEVRENNSNAALFDEFATMNTGDAPGHSVGKMRTVLAFGLDGISEGATITNANLTLRAHSLDLLDGGAGLGPMELRLVQHATDSMGEGEVNWTNVDADTAWATPGGDFTTLLGTIEVDDTGRYTFVSNEEFIAAVQAALDAGVPLELMIVSPETEAAGERNFVRWHSDDAASVNDRPLLTVSWIEGAATVVPEPTVVGLVLVALAGVRHRRRQAD